MEEQLELFARFLTKYSITPVIATLSLVAYCATATATKPPAELFFLVGIATWCIYMLDHYYDGLHADGVSDPAVYTVSSPIFLKTICIVSCLDLVAALILLPVKTLFMCGVICLLVVAHLLVTNKTQIYEQVPLLKEITVSGIYSLGVFGVVLSYSYAPQLVDLWILGVVFGVVCCNVVLVSNSNKTIRRFVASLGGLVFASVCLYFRTHVYVPQVSHNAFGLSIEPFILALFGIVIVQLLVVVFMSTSVSESKRRMYADLALLPISLLVVRLFI